MTGIRRGDGLPSIDYTARDRDGLLAAMRALIPDKLPEWTGYTSEADFGNVLLELFAHMGDILGYYQDRVANEAFLGTARTRRGVIQHLRLIGYELSTAAPAVATVVVSLPSAAQGRVVIDRGVAFATRSGKDRPSVRFEYNDAPKTVDLAGLPSDATGRKLLTLVVEEGRLVRDELLGVSDGSPGQRFALHHAPLILRSRAATGRGPQDISLVTRLGGGTVDWRLRETLAFSHVTAAAGGTQQAQRDYVIEIDEDDRATVVFGDGLLGSIPDKGAEVRATYRVGGGAAGNVPAGAIGTIVAAPAPLLGAKVTNPEPAGNGADRESIERAVQHAPAIFRSQRRAVTAADYEALALDCPGVGKVRARPSSWNTVTLYVAPAGGGPVSDVLRADLLAYFEDRRPIATRIEIAAAAYVVIEVTAEIGVLPYYSRADVERNVRSAAGALLAFPAVDFAQRLFLSRFYEVIEAVDGVLYVNVSRFRRADRPADPDDPASQVDPTGVLALGEYELPVAPGDAAHEGGIQVIVKEGGF
ncbi:baseplate J/gp47 family protein [Actinomadura sp. NPDC047616]|uniref:baseplate J/gp47 family protein n=1 Tax=Actinomadura sp. NPDC047616 TaxID=3155914 RepID=UPI0033F1A4A3